MKTIKKSINNPKFDIEALKKELMIIEEFIYNNEEYKHKPMAQIFDFLF